MVKEYAFNHNYPSPPKRKHTHKIYNKENLLLETIWVARLTLTTKEKWEVIWGSKISQLSQGWDISVEPVKRGTPRYVLHLLRSGLDFAFFFFFTWECVLTETANILKYKWWMKLAHPVTMHIIITKLILTMSVPWAGTVLKRFTWVTLFNLHNKPLM